MPHMIVEYTDNITLDTRILAQELHECLEKELPTNIAGCKSRFIELSDYVVGDGASEERFIHVTLQALATRTDDKYQNAANAIISHFKKVTSDDVQISISVEMLPQLYFKA